MEQEYPKIDYQLIGKAISYYTNLGYAYIEVPWLVPDKAINVTFNGEVKRFENDTRILVGSAEQSFIHMMQSNTLPYGKHVACTPCFRIENYDSLHQEYFIKVELIIFVENKSDSYTNGLYNMLLDASDFFKEHSKNIKIEKTGEGYDLTLNGVEIGSYGIRHHENFTWIYGTGLAEPRFGIAKEYDKN